MGLDLGDVFDCLVLLELLMLGVGGVVLYFVCVGVVDDVVGVDDVGPPSSSC